MRDKIERTNLVSLTRFRFRPADVRWVELDVVAQLSGKRYTKLQLCDGKLFMCESDEPGYREDVDTILFATDPDNWICRKHKLDATEEM